MTTTSRPMVSTMTWRLRPGHLLGVVAPGVSGNGVGTLHALGVYDRAHPERPEASEECRRDPRSVEIGPKGFLAACTARHLRAVVLDACTRQASRTSYDGTAFTARRVARADVDPVPARSGEGHRGNGLLHRRHRLLTALLRAVRRRSRQPRRSPARGDGQPGHGLGHPGGAQLHLGSPRRRTSVPLPHPRPGHEVHGVFDEAYRASGIEAIRTPVRSPQANAFAERWVRTVRQECLDRLLISSRRHLEAVLDAYVRHYNEARPHRGRQLATPLPRHDQPRIGETCRRDILGDIIHECDWAA